MNTLQLQLFHDLRSLIKTNEAFYSQKFENNGHIYEIFNYRLASYSDFLLPGALECRGVMFEVNAEGNPVELKVLPMEKFFNLYENPFTMDVDLTQVDEILLKADGSLMSTYVEDGELKLKSKGSIFSEQCIAAMNWLETKPEFKQSLHNLTLQGYTVNLEWCSPIHRIVIGYSYDHLKVLNARNRFDFQYANRQLLLDYFGEENVIELVSPDNPVEFVNSIPDMQDNIEGYVIRLKNGQRIKIKTKKYLSLHYVKDSVNNPRRLFEAIVDETVDDLRSMFYDDPITIAKIDDMQQKVDHIYNSYVKLVEDFYQANKNLDRKNYAIKGQQEIRPEWLFSRAMNMYLGKDPDWKSFLKSKYKELGFNDIENNGDNE